MAIDKKAEASFLSKFNRKSVYLDSENEFFESIVEEIGNILSTKLKKLDDREESPFSYGIRDLQSLEISKNSIDEFKIHCCNMILKFEPRISDISVNNYHFDNKSQLLAMEFVCQTVKFSNSFITNILIKI
ncbi:MAG: GPW/gp25 family protein [Holosporales bacterium]|jgi:predicted component of type VI protein secretion system|nr:GPW/gp25 family protein [Holosporales bacterium]